METQVVKFDVTEAAIAEMKELYGGLVITDINDQEQYDAVHSAHMVVRKNRIAVEKKGKELRTEAIAWQKAVLEKEKKIVGLIEPLESHLKEEKQKVKDEKERIENERIAAIQEKIDAIKKFDANLYHATAHELKSIIDTIENIEITPEMFFEFTTEANELKQKVLISTCQTLEDREKRDKEEAERKAEAERLAKEREEFEKAKAEQAEKDRIEREKREAEQAKLKAEQKAAQDKIDEQNRKIQAEKDAIEAEQKAEQERKDREEFERKAKEDAKIQAEKDAAEAKRIAEREAAEAKEREDAERERQEALKPDKEKLHAFSQFLVQGVTFPEVKSEEATEILKEASKTIAALSVRVYEAAEAM